MRISKNILLKEIPFEARDCHALELYLSEMAAKGWMLDEIWIFNIFKLKGVSIKSEICGGYSKVIRYMP